MLIVIDGKHGRLVNYYGKPEEVDILVQEVIEQIIRRKLKR